MSDGWRKLLKDWPWSQGEGSFPVLPNSEFMPPVRLVRKPYGAWDQPVLADDDPWGWPINEYDELLTLRPGLRSIAGHLLAQLVLLGQGSDAHDISEFKLRGNPYWPDELARHAGRLHHERYVLLLPVALSITQDDKAHARWTLFGNSEQEPAHAFWKGFFTAPGQELPAEEALPFFRTLLARAYGEPGKQRMDLHGAGFRILKERRGAPLPSWAKDYLHEDQAPLRGVKYLLTFRPFQELPAAVRRRYLAGDLHLLPFPGSLLFWGVSYYTRLAEHLRLAMQVPLLHFLERREGRGKIRVPQSGWFKEVGPLSAARDSDHGHGPMRETYKRTHRHARVHRYADSLVTAREHHLTHVLFSTRPDDIGLYHKPMARNVQLWTEDFRPLLDGPAASVDDLRSAAHVVADGGIFGYRFVFPAMRVGQHELYWHRPLAAYWNASSGRSVFLDQAPLGYLTAYPAEKKDLDHPLELWPRLLQREAHLANIELFQDLKENPPWRTLGNVGKLLDAWQRLGSSPLPRSFARQLLTVRKTRTLEGWLRGLPTRVKPAKRAAARQLAKDLRGYLALEDVAPKTARAKNLPAALTFKHTASRRFEEEYWNTIALLSAGDFINKNNADCVLDRPTQAALVHPGRDLEGMGDYLLRYYEQLIRSQDMTGNVLFGELPFRWHTEYSFSWMGGWLNNQEGKTHERNLLVMIPGRDRRRAVIMADHYDTAYMLDCYDPHWGGTGARLAAAGADDNCSATAALMLGARAFLDLSRQGRLSCDVWLLHLTGEEYPAEGLGACRMCQWLVEDTLALHGADGRRHDLSGVSIQGLYVLDMVAHNNHKARDVFQIAPGASRESLWLAQQAHLATRSWNQAVEGWNRQPARRRAGHGRRSRDGKTLPSLSRHLPLYGEIRPHNDPRSTLYNTDGQAFSDIGVPVVLFMENYDIDRMGYHDTHDNMTNIDLDYGAALAAITIESVAQAAAAEPPFPEAMTPPRVSQIPGALT